MSLYAFAVYFWSVVVAVAFVLPFAARFARDAWTAIEHLLVHHHELGSGPSAPRPSRP
jgi:hypothetical protein